MAETTTGRMSPFSCGTQYMDWADKNCGNCKRDVTCCPIALALEEACWGDGMISHEIAERVGAIRWRGHYCWPCGELEPASQAVAEGVAAFEQKYEPQTMEEGE